MILKYPKYIDDLWKEIMPYFDENGDFLVDTPESIKEKFKIVSDWEDEQRRIVDEIEVKSDPASYFKKHF